MTEWKPIETAPKDGSYILLWPCNRGEKIVVNSGYWHQPGNPAVAGFWIFGSHSAKQGLTHWMPLPAPPVSTLDETSP